MAIDTEKTLLEINEVTLILNSNMNDTKRAADEGKRALLDGVQELTVLNEDVKQEIKKIETQFSTKVQKLEANLQQKLKETSSFTNLSLKNEHSDLRQKLDANLQEEKEIISQNQKEQVKSFQKIYSMLEESMKAQKDMILYLNERIGDGFDKTEKNHKKLSKLVTELRTTVTIESDKLTKGMLEQHQILKKSQRKWFIFLIIFIFLGYFI
ncbi:hypothetical protein V7182_22285 [Neobacillus drentensis]|uniref:hypothetical protein n=1 Tax=Neobacillus drentensis TaxID=220684 RepID=UPI003000A98B